MAKLVPLFSGSQGNSYYIASGGKGILIDVGRSAKQMTAALNDNNIDISSIQAIFITHEHTDHAKGVRVFANKYAIPVFSTLGTQQAMKRLNLVDEKTNCRLIQSGGVDLDTMHVDSFPISHDCAEGCGYRVTMNDVKFALATDLGYLSEEVENALTGCDTVVIESNHDVRMLQMGPYPYNLKRRIMSDIGHLSNTVCAELLPKLVRNGTKRFVLAHLSRENNMPEIAYQESLNELTARGMALNSDFTLTVAPVATDGRSVIF
ncbi:MAG: MBL fold metallo-hydrolase [Clostridia bacterium]|nr:MBL fold metallo-hydrolase [Clostridia bacterium]